MLRITALMASLLLALAPPAFAEVGSGLSPAEEILSTLRQRGYRVLEDERTWLGRQRIVVEKNGARREVVFNPGTGEILRDYSFRIEAGGGSRDTTQTATGTATGSGNTGVATAVAAEPGLSVGESVGDLVAGGSGNSNSQAKD